MKIKVNWRMIPQKIIWLVKEEIKILFTPKCGIIYLIRQWICIILNKRKIKFLGSDFYYEGRFDPFFVLISEIKNLYKFLNIKSKDIPLRVLEIGGNVGFWGFTFNKLYPNTEIFTFEPNTTPYKLLNLNSKYFPNWKIFNYGIGATKKTESLFYIKDKSGQGSIYKNYVNKNLITESEIIPIKVELIKIDTEFAKTNLNGTHFDIIKIDTEGSEWEVIKGIQSLSFENMYVELTFTKNSNDIKYELSKENCYKQIDKFYMYCKNYWPNIILIHKIIHGDYYTELYFKNS